MLAASIAISQTPFASAGEPQVPAADFQLIGRMTVGDKSLYRVKSNLSTERPQWLPLGAAIDGYVALTYDDAAESLTLRKGKKTITVKMDSSKIIDGKFSADARRIAEEKMAKMKPALEGGMPIKGVVVLLLGGSVAERPVEFVMGKETRIEIGDGTFTVKPSLDKIGTVTYAIALVEKGSDGTPEKTTLRTRVTQTPWGGFSFSSNEGKSFGFHPDEGQP